MRRQPCMHDSCQPLQQAWRRGARQDGFHGRVHFYRVPFMQGRDQGILVGKVLVDGADADPGAFGNQIGIGSCIAALAQNASRSFKNCIDQGP